MNRILVLAPHPDDESIGCGGTLCRHVQQGDEVHVVFLTSGEKGGHGRSEPATIRLRESEAHRAASVIGIPEIEFWHLPDGAVRSSPSAIDRVRKKLLQFKPHTVYVTHEREMHPDHRGAVRLLRRALEKFPEKHPEVLGFEVWTPIQRLSVIVDISPFMEQKLRAIRTYHSQCAVVGFVQAVRGLNRYRGEMHSWPGGNYAEVFTRVRT